MSSNSPLIKSLCRRGRVIVAEDKARDRVESGDSGRECIAVIRPQGPDAARMDFFNGLLTILQAPTRRRRLLRMHRSRSLSRWPLDVPDACLPERHARMLTGITVTFRSLHKVTSCPNHSTGSNDLYRLSTAHECAHATGLRVPVDRPESGLNNPRGGRLTRWRTAAPNILDNPAVIATRSVMRCLSS